MVPGSWLSVLLFFLLVAPGLLFDLLSERRRVGSPESTFREISRVVLSSLAFSGVAFAVLVILRIVHPSWLPDPRRLLEPKGSYARDHYRLLFRTLVLEVSLALTAVWAWDTVLTRTQGGATIRTVSAWTQVLKRDRPKDHDAYVRVRLHDGVVYSGLVAHFSPDLEVDGRELILAPPLESSTGDKPTTALPVVYQRVVIRGSAIDVLSVEYRPKRRHNAAVQSAPGSMTSSSPATQGEREREPG